MLITLMLQPSRELVNAVSPHEFSESESYFIRNAKIHVKNREKVTKT